MGRKRKKKKGTKHASEAGLTGLAEGALASELEGRLQAGRFHHALGVARELRRRGLVASHRGLIERAYTLRTGELLSGRIFDQALTIAENALDCGVATAELGVAVVRSAVAIGRVQRAKQWIDRALIDADCRSILRADIAVLEPVSDGETSPPESLPGIESLRRAFAHHEAGRDDEAQRELAAIGRRSPLAPWRLFLRGLAAQSAGDAEAAKQVWGRLPAHGICRWLAGERLGVAASGLPKSVRTASSSPDRRVAALRAVQVAARTLEDDDPFVDDASALLGAVERALRTGLRNATVSERRRLFRCCLGEAGLDAETYQRLGDLLGSPCEDPHGARQGAAWAEKDDSQEAHSDWRQYLKYLSSVEGLTRVERKLARALLWERIGDLARQDAKDAADSSCRCSFCRRRRRRYEDTLEPGAFECYEKAIEFDPDEPGVRHKLAALYLDARRGKDAERILLELVERFPEDVDAHLQIGDACFRRKAYLKAARRFETAQKLAPFDRKVLERVAECNVASARRRAAKGRFDLARQDFAKAEGVLGGRLQPAQSIFHAALERVAHQRGDSEALWRRAVEDGLWKPEACRQMVEALGELGAPAAVRTDFRQRILSALEDLPVEIDTAGRAAELLLDVADLGGDLAHTESVRRRLVAYLETCVELDFPALKRLELCHALQASGSAATLVAFARRGRSQFPKEVEFPVLEVEGGLKSGSWDISEDLVEALREHVEGESTGRGDRGPYRRLLVAQVIADKLFDQQDSLDPPAAPPARAARRGPRRGKRGAASAQRDPVFEQATFAFATEEPGEAPAPAGKAGGEDSS